MNNVEELRDALDERISEIDHKLEKLVAETIELRNERYVLVKALAAVEEAAKEVDDN